MPLLSMSDFHPYQHNAATALYEHNRILAMMPTGAGKTIAGLTAIAELQVEGAVRRAVLLAPRRVAATVWPVEPAKWEHTKHLKVDAIIGTPKQRVKALESNADMQCIGVNNIEWLRDEMRKWPKDDPRFDLLVFDESSKCKNPTGAWAKILMHDIAPMFKMIWLLTGSPRPNSELDYYVPMAVLTDKTIWGRSFDRWRRTNFYPTDYEQRVWELHPHKADALNNDVARYAFRVDNEDVPRPASDPIIHRVTLNRKARMHYTMMKNKMLAEIRDPDNLTSKDIVAINAAVTSGKLAQMAQGFVYDDEKVAHSLHTAKMDMLNDLLEGTGAATAIIYWFKEDLSRLLDNDKNMEFLGAGVSEQRSIDIIKDWNAGNIQTLALHPASAGHGLNMQGTVAQMVHYALTWSAELYDQTVARIARQGYSEALMLNHHIVADDTVDDMKMARVEEKLSNQEAAMRYIRTV